MTDRIDEVRAGLNITEETWRPPTPDDTLYLLAIAEAARDLRRANRDSYIDDTQFAALEAALDADGQDNPVRMREAEEDRD